MKTKTWKNPIKQCVCCLYRTGLGVGRIAKITGHSNSICFRWVRKAGLIDPARVNRGGKRGSRLLQDDVKIKQKVHDLIMWEYKREQRLSDRPDRLWLRHPVRDTHESVKSQKYRMANNPQYRAIFYARKRVREYCKHAAITKRFSTSRLLGCNARTLKTHIESRFRDGMSWGNHGLIWEIDHIIPLASATNQRQLVPLCRYTNLQPLLVLENRRKGDKRMRQASLL